MSKLKIAAIIPARMASSRYPGKPLINIQGLPMIEHVRRRTLMCDSFSDVVVATCDLEIFNVVKEFGGEVMMTSANHIIASDRVAEASEKLDCEYIINVQGDEILVFPEDLDRMIASIQSNPDRQYWNATAKIETNDELGDESIVKCIVSKSGKIIYCCRNFSHLQLTNGFEPVQKIIGVLGYSREGLSNYIYLSRTPIEEIQSIEQSRIIEHDIPIKAVPFSNGYPGINDKEEEKKVREILKMDSRQKKLLEKILN